MKINIKNPEFLLNTLKNDVVNRTHYLVSQGIAFDADWRDAFVDLFDLIEQLETTPGEKLEGPVPVPPNEAAVDFPETTTPEADANPFSKRNLFPVGTPVQVGKGKTVWIVSELQQELAILKHTTDKGRERKSTVLIEQLKAVKY